MKWGLFTTHSPNAHWPSRAFDPSVQLNNWLAWVKVKWELLTITDWLTDWLLRKQVLILCPALHSPIIISLYPQQPAAKQPFIASCTIFIPMAKHSFCSIDGEFKLCSYLLSRSCFVLNPSCYKHYTLFAIWISAIDSLAASSSTLQQLI